MNILKSFIFLAALSASSASIASNIVIGSFNIRRSGIEASNEHLWANRLPGIKLLLADQKPTIIGFQEATQVQIQDLQMALPDYGYFGTGRGSWWWGVLIPDESVPLFYNKNVVTLLDSGTFSISPGSYLLYDMASKGLFPRICTWGHFEVKESGQQLYVFNVHLDHLKDEAARILGLSTAVKWIDEHVRDTTIPVFLMGDFNSDITSSIATIVGSFTNVRDKAKIVEGPQNTFTGWGKKPEMKIDHILVKNDMLLLLEKFVTIPDPEDRYFSDHRAILATIQI